MNRVANEYFYFIFFFKFDGLFTKLRVMLVLCTNLNHWNFKQKFIPTVYLFINLFKLTTYF